MAGSIAAVALDVFGHGAVIGHMLAIVAPIAFPFHYCPSFLFTFTDRAGLPLTLASLLCFLIPIVRGIYLIDGCRTACRGLSV